MTLLEAFELTLSKVKELEDSGIKVKRVPSHNNDYYNLNEDSSLPKDKWCAVSFTCSSQEQMNKLHEVERILGDQGIGFDTGAGFGSRDWELDWSFSLDADSENEESE